MNHDKLWTPGKKLRALEGRGGEGRGRERKGEEGSGPWVA